MFSSVNHILRPQSSAEKCRHFISDMTVCPIKNSHVFLIKILSLNVDVKTRERYNLWFHLNNFGFLNIISAVISDIILDIIDDPITSQ